MQHECSVQNVALIPGDDPSAETICMQYITMCDYVRHSITTKIFSRGIFRASRVTHWFTSSNEQQSAATTYLELPWAKNTVSSASMSLTSSP